MNPTPFWLDLRAKDPDLHDFLVRISALMYLAKVASVPRPEVEDPLLAIAIAKDLLTLKAEMLEFVRSDIKDEYLIRLAFESLNREWEDLEAFSDKLRDALHRLARLEVDHSSKGKLVELLARESGRDIVARTGELAKATVPAGHRSRVWDIYPLFCQVLSKVEPDPEVLAEALHQIALATANDLASGREYGAITELARRSAEYTRSMISTFLARSESPVVSYLPAALVGLAKFSFQEAFERAEELTLAEQLFLRRAGVEALGRLPELSSDPTYREKASARLTAMVAIPDAELDYLYLRAAGNLLELSPEIGEMIPVLARRGGRAARQQAASVLQRFESCSNMAWYSATVQALTSCSSDEDVTLLMLDEALAAIAVRDPTIPLMFLEAFLPGVLDKLEDEGELWGSLDRTFEIFLDDQREALERAVTLWLASESQDLHAAAIFIVRFAIRKPLPLGLDQQTLAGMAEEEVAAVLKRAIARLPATPEPAVDLLLSVPCGEPKQSKLLDFVEFVLRDVLLYNFPGKARAHLQLRLRDGLPDGAKTAATNALVSSEAYFTSLNQLPRLLELRQPLNRRFLANLANIEFGRRVAQASKDSSPLLSLVTTVEVKYGRTCSLELDGGQFTDPTEMNRHSQEFEVPRGEMINPVGQALRRIHWSQVRSEPAKEDKR